MCGIAGIIYRSDPLDTNVIERMTQALAHRGPDDSQTMRFEGCDLGHRRLSIIDLSTGKQPMSDASGRYWISFNGEIFNYRELRRTLEEHGCSFVTKSDTEVILRGYETYGDAVVEHLIGQFAFLIWDTQTRTLFAARDPLGEKPLYYAISQQGDLLFASEIKGLIASGQFTPKLDRPALELYRSLLYVPPFQTIYENVHTLQPGHRLSWHDGNLKISAYWQPNLAPQPSIDPRDAVEQLRVLIDRAVHRQMVSDVPIGAFLSGGLDSSTIVALMSRHTSQAVKTFAVGFGNLINELPYAAEIAKRYQTDHHEIQMDIPVAEMLECMALVYDEPFADSSNIPTYLISEYARQFVTVVLSGDGGDELFGGYAWYQFLLDDEKFSEDGANRALVGMTALALRALAKAGVPLQAERDRFVYQLRRLDLLERYPDIWDRHLATMSYVPLSAKSNGALQSHYHPTESVEGIDRASDFDLRCYLPGDILVKVDRAAMAHGLESRAPFLDVELVNFVLSLPARLRFRNGATKDLLSEAYGALWTDTVRGRSKQGFGAPIINWLSRPDVGQLIDRMCLSDSPLTALYPDDVRAWDDHSAQDQWTLLCLGVWLEQHAETL